ncbi:E3 ubiquitin-protein ligase [Trichinella pseudospiralis]
MPRCGSWTPLALDIIIYYALDSLSGGLRDYTVWRRITKVTVNQYLIISTTVIENIYTYSGGHGGVDCGNVVPWVYLCGDCHFKKHISNFHTNSHSMQCVGVETDDEQLSLTCPFCSERGFYLDNLASHVHIDHTEETAEVKCPVCVAQGNSVGLLKYEDLRLHLSYLHEFGTLTTQRQSMVIEYINQYVNMSTLAGIYGSPILRGVGYDFLMFPYQFSGNLLYDEYGYIYTEGKDPRNRG